MTDQKKKPEKSDIDIVKAIDRLFDDLDENEDSEETHTALREMGQDPDALVAKGLARITAARSQSPLHWRNRNRQELERAREALGTGEVEASQPRSVLEQTIGEIVAAFKGKTERVPAQLFRNVTELNDQDLAIYLQELLYHAKNAGIDMENQE